MADLGAFVIQETNHYRLEWAPSQLMWVVRRDGQPVAWFDGEDLLLAQEFMADMNRDEADELLIAKTHAL